MASSKSRGSEEIDASATAIIHVTKEDGQINAATWVKHRCWQLSEVQEQKWFAVEDRGDMTIITPAAKPERKKKGSGNQL